MRFIGSWLMEVFLREFLLIFSLRVFIMSFSIFLLPLRLMSWISMRFFLIQLIIYLMIRIIMFICWLIHSQILKGWISLKSMIKRLLEVFTFILLYYYHIDNYYFRFIIIILIFILFILDYNFINKNYKQNLKSQQN
jgi:hypothetical protein